MFHFSVSNNYLRRNFLQYFHQSSDIHSLIYFNLILYENEKFMDQ